MKRPVCVAAAVAALGAFAVTDAELGKLVAEDLAKPVRPVGANGQAEFWNANATWFMYPPEIAFPEKQGADGYRIRVVGADGKVKDFGQKTSVVSFEKFWSELPVGRTEVWCDPYAYGHYRWAVARHFRVFWKMAPYRPGSYPKAPYGYAEAATKCCEYLLNMPWLKTYAETGKPDPAYKFNCYPAKMDAAVISLMCDYAKHVPARKGAAVRLARAAADHLLSVSQPAGAPLAHFPPTYRGTNYTAGQYAGMNMLIHPAEAGLAYVKLHVATGEKKYLEAAKAVAATYLKLQGADGTWYLKMYEKDGKPVNANRLHPMTVIDFMELLATVTGDARYRACAERAFGFYEKGPLADWNWEGQFEDVAPTEKYVNLTKHSACSVAMYMLTRWPKDAKRIAQAREILRFSEDQFVVWERPADKGACNLMDVRGESWAVVPAVVEQYYYREAVDASAEKLMLTYLALYRATGNPLDLAKAKTLGDSLVRVQQPSGRIPTVWPTETLGDPQYDWLNCMAVSAGALFDLANEDTKEH